MGLVNYSEGTAERFSRSHALPGERDALMQAMSDMAEERPRYRLDVEFDLTHGTGI